MAAIEGGPKTEASVELTLSGTQESTNVSQYTFRKEDEEFPYVDVKVKRLPRGKEHISVHGPVALEYEGQRVPYRRLSPRTSSLELKTANLPEANRIEVAHGLASLMFELQHVTEEE
jgi:hypothetical protein